MSARSRAHPCKNTARAHDACAPGHSTRACRCSASPASVPDRAKRRVLSSRSDEHAPQCQREKGAALTAFGKLLPSPGFSVCTSTPMISIRLAVLVENWIHPVLPRHSRAQAAMEMRWSLVQLEGNAREIVRFLQRKETCLQETRLKERRLRLSSAELLHRPFPAWKSGFLLSPYPHPAESVDEFSFLREVFFLPHLK